jgi:hypothetical protein
MWLRYDGLLPPTDPIAGKLRIETNALLERVIFERRLSWFDLLRSKETFVDETLAAHYGGGMPKPAPGGAKWKWVPYGASGPQERGFSGADREVRRLWR